MNTSMVNPVKTFIEFRKMHETMCPIKVGIMKKDDGDGFECEEVSRCIGKHHRVSGFIEKNSKDYRDDSCKKDVSPEVTLFELCLGRRRVSRQFSLRNVLEGEGYEWNIENQQQQKRFAGIESIEKAERLPSGLGENMKHEGDHEGKCIEKWDDLTTIFLIDMPSISAIILPQNRNEI